MSDAIYHLTVIVLAALGVVRGYRSGLSGQLAGITGICFGIVCAHLFFDPVYEWMTQYFPETRLRLGGDYLLRMLSASAVFLLIYSIIAMLGPVLKSAMSVFPSGLLGSVAGALLGLLKYMFFVSIFFNIIVDYNPYSSLLKFATDGDGNVVAGVMVLAPASFGVPGCDDLAHARRLEEAKRISFLNPPPSSYVITLVDPTRLITTSEYA